MALFYHPAALTEPAKDPLLPVSRLLEMPAGMAKIPAKKEPTSCGEV
ncbi:MAG TPA: hypothetical protein VND64_01380 [Pirellulales bacterium]|nr:hypothetical protein [Pirellulales bacterium]